MWMVAKAMTVGNNGQKYKNNNLVEKKLKFLF